MATDSRRAPDPVGLLDAIGAEPYRFDFYQAVRRLEAAYPQSPRVGDARRCREEPLRFGQQVSLAFAPSTVSELVPRTERGTPARLRVAFFGLFGPNGPLPLHLTEYAHARALHAGDRTLAAFADIFHHRLLSIFYRIRARANPVSSLDRPGDRRFPLFVGSFAGLGLPSMCGRDSVPDLAKYARIGLLSRATASASGLATLIADYFRLPVRIEEFTAHWMSLPEDSLTRLGHGEVAELGGTAVIGSRVWDLQSRFRVVIGPLTLDEYERFLPTGSSFQRLVDWILNYAGFALAWDCKLILNKNEAPPLVLGFSGRLGWTTWLGARIQDRDAEDLVLRPPTRPGHVDTRELYPAAGGSDGEKSGSRQTPRPGAAVAWQ